MFLKIFDKTELYHNVYMQSFNKYGYGCCFELETHMFPEIRNQILIETVLKNGVINV